MQYLATQSKKVACYTIHPCITTSKYMYVSTVVWAFIERKISRFVYTSENALLGQASNEKEIACS